MGLAAAHDPDVRADGDRLEPEPLEGPDVGAVLRPVARVEAGLVAVAAVGVLHDELADADEPAAGARLVAPLGLEVIDLHRQLAVRLDDVGEQQADDLLVGHRQDHVAAVAVLEPAQLGPDRVVAAARPPDVGRVDDRHLDLLAADPVLLLADDLLDPVVDALAERQQRVDPGAELADVAGAQQQAMRRHLGIGRVVAKRGEEEVGQAHGRVRIAAATAATMVSTGCTDRAQSRGVPSAPDRHRPDPEARIDLGKASRSRLVVVIVLAVAFDYVNGFHDTANAIATSVATRALIPRHAILMATAFNFIGAFAGTAVAKTIGSGLVDEATTTQAVVAAALIGAITWNLITW